MNASDAYTLARMLGQWGMSFTKPGDFGYDLGMQDIQQANAGLKAEAQKKYEKEQEKAKKGGTLGKILGTVGTVAGNVVGGPIGGFIGGTLGNAGGAYLGGAEPDWGNIVASNAMNGAVNVGMNGLGNYLDMKANPGTTEDMIVGDLGAGGKGWTAANDMYNAVAPALHDAVGGYIPMPFTVGGDTGQEPTLGGVTKSIANTAIPTLGSYLTGGGIGGGLPIVKQPHLDTSRLTSEDASALQQQVSQQQAQDEERAAQLRQAQYMNDYRRAQLDLQRQTQKSLADYRNADLRMQQQRLDAPSYESVPGANTVTVNGVELPTVRKTEKGQTSIQTLPLPEGAKIPPKETADPMVSIGSVPRSIYNTVLGVQAKGGQPTTPEEADAMARYNAAQREASKEYARKQALKPQKVGSNKGTVINPNDLIPDPNNKGGSLLIVQGKDNSVTLTPVGVPTPTKQQTVSEDIAMFNVGTGAIKSIISLVSKPTKDPVTEEVIPGDVNAAIALGNLASQYVESLRAAKIPETQGGRFVPSNNNGVWTLSVVKEGHQKVLGSVKSTAGAQQAAPSGGGWVK